MILEKKPLGEETLGPYHKHYELIDQIMRTRAQPDSIHPDGFYDWAGPLEELRLTFQNHEGMNLDGSPTWGTAHEMYISESVVPMFKELRVSPRLIIEIGVGPTARLVRNWAGHFPNVEILGIDMDPQKVEAARTTLEQLGYDPGKVQIVEGEASRVLAEIEGQADIVGVQNLFQHLSSRKADGGASPFGLVVDAMENVLRPGGLAVVSDLLLAGPESWKIAPKGEYAEDDPDVVEAREVQARYLGNEETPGILFFAWKAKGGHVWTSGQDVAEELVRHAQNLQLIEGSQQDYPAGLTTGRDSNPCSIIGATVPPTVALGIEGAKAKLQKALESPRLSKKQRKELLNTLEQLEYAANFAWKEGLEYLEKVFYNPKTTVSVPWISFQIWEKGVQPTR